MSRTMSVVSGFALAIALALSAGCIKQKQAMTLMPDGSGKIEFTVGINEAVFKQLNPEAKPLEDFSPDKLSESTDGFVAISKPKQWQENGWSYVQFNAYFEDVNKLVLDKEEEQAARFELKRDGDAFTLTAKHGVVGRMMSDIAGNEPEEEDAAQAAMKKQMLQGFEVVESYTMPATVAAAEGMKVEGKTASVAASSEQVLDPAKAKPLAAEQRVISAKGDTTDDAAVKAFKEEMAKAKAEWEAMKKAAAEQPAEAPAPAPTVPAE